MAIVSILTFLFILRHKKEAEYKNHMQNMCCMGFFSKGGIKMDNCVMKCKMNRSWIRFVLYIMYGINAIITILLKDKAHLTANKHKHTTLSFCWSSMRYYNEGIESTAKAMEKLDCWKHLHDYSSPLFLSANKLQQIFQSYVRQICAGLWVCVCVCL